MRSDFNLAGIDIVVNTHLHFDHRGGNHLFAGRPIYVQRRELDDARSEDDYTIREWVEAPGVRYVPVDGEHELLPGLRLPRRRATHAACRWSSLRQAGVRSSSVATWRSGSVSSTSRTPKASEVLCHLRSGALRRKLSSMPRSRRFLELVWRLLGCIERREEQGEAVDRQAHNQPADPVAEIIPNTQPSRRQTNDDAATNPQAEWAPGRSRSRSRFGTS